MRVGVRHAILGLAAAGLVVAVFTRSPIAQDPAYHVMADQRPLLGIPNCLNVISNVPFAIAGLAGLLTLFARQATRGVFKDPWERFPYAVLFTGSMLTAVGSAYYHVFPDNTTLVWDRLPMTIAFIGLLTAVIAERVSASVARRLLVPLLIAGAGSVAYWHWTELRGAGDLRAYALVQFGSLLLVVLLLLLYPARYPGAGYIYAGLALYGLAKVFELADEAIFSLGELVSGHTLKHLAAAAGACCLAAMIRARSRSFKPLK